MEQVPFLQLSSHALIKRETLYKTSKQNFTKADIIV